MSPTAFNVPINTVSFGQLSTLLLKTFYQRVLTARGDSSPTLRVFPYGGQVDLSAQVKDDMFELWLKKCTDEALEDHKKTDPIFKLWHLVGSMESHSCEQSLLSFYELDSPTKVEINIAKNNKTFFSSQYTCDIFKSVGVDCGYIPLAFDNFNFQQTGKKYFDDDRITFLVVGKLEKRKGHEKILSAWAKKFGNNKKYFLNCALYNPFLQSEQNNAIVHQALSGEKYFNINFVNYMAENQVYNDFLNSGDIVIGMSGGEGWGLPEFHAMAMGKYGIIMNAHGYKGWANEKNSILVDPSGKIDSTDGIFFQKDRNHNQGKIFDFDEDDFISACEEAIKKHADNPENKEGLKLQEEFSKTKFLDNVLATL